MNDLPTPNGDPPAGGPISTNNPTRLPAPASPPAKPVEAARERSDGGQVIQSGTSVGLNKEVDAGRAEVPFRPAGQEIEVSPEVASAGVKVQSTTIPIPSSVSQMGVQSVGQNVPVATPAVTLPLSDDQIAIGLRQSIWSSWRWLAEWCVRKLKQLHMGLKNVHGRLTRVRQ